MTTYHLHSWAIVSLHNDPYMSPELNPKCLSGYRDQSEKKVLTTPIAKIDGRTVTTRSGSVYLLEDISDTYKAWMDSEGIPYDPDNPVHIKKSKP